jgi:hypothetical protein
MPAWPVLVLHRLLQAWGVLMPTSGKRRDPPVHPTPMSLRSTAPPPQPQRAITMPCMSCGNAAQAVASMMMPTPEKREETHLAVQHQRPSIVQHHRHNHRGQEGGGCCIEGVGSCLPTLQKVEGVQLGRVGGICGVTGAMRTHLQGANKRQRSSFSKTVGSMHNPACRHCRR